MDLSTDQETRLVTLILPKSDPNRKRWFDGYGVGPGFIPPNFSFHIKKDQIYFKHRLIKDPEVCQSRLG